MYQPQVSRWVSVDPNALQLLSLRFDEFDSYFYGYNDPVTAADPTGEYPTPIHNELEPMGLVSDKDPELGDIENYLLSWLDKYLDNTNANLPVFPGNTCGKVCSDFHFGPCRVTLQPGEHKPHCLLGAIWTEWRIKKWKANWTNACAELECVWCDCEDRAEFDSPPDTKPWSIPYNAAFCKFTITCPRSYREYGDKGKCGKIQLPLPWPL